MTIHELDPRFTLGKEVGVKQGQPVLEFPVEKKVGETHEFSSPPRGLKVREIHTRVLRVISPDEIEVLPCMDTICPISRENPRTIFKDGINATPITREIYKWSP